MITHDMSRYLPNLGAAQQTITIGSSAVTLASLLGTALHAATDLVVLVFETDAVRISPVGTVPTATLGVLRYPGQVIALTRGEADCARLIRVATDAKAQVLEYKRQ